MRWALVLGFMLCLAGCNMPRDPEGSFERIQGGVLRAGITANQPWTSVAGETSTDSEPPDPEPASFQPTGIEVELLQQFAREIDARIEWTHGSESELFDGLERGSLDVVIGGLKDDTPWSSKVALTQPYLALQGDKHVMAVRQGENRWLLELDKFLQRHRGEAVRLHRRHAQEGER